jgi:hypothetical protein
VLRHRILLGSQIARTETAPGKRELGKQSIGGNVALQTVTQRYPLGLLHG